MYPASATSHQPRAILVEDEADLRAEIRDLLKHRWGNLSIVGEARDGFAAKDLVKSLQPDILFLDIKIPGPNGLEVAAAVGDLCHIVFITAYDAYAIEAFEQGAVDYVLKPIQPDRFAVTINRLQKITQYPANKKIAPTPDTQRSTPKSRHIKWITATNGNAFRLVMIDEVIFFQADNRYTRVVLADSEVLISKTLKELLEELDPDQFWQIHRSTIVNAMEISSIEPDIASRLTVKLKNRRDRLAVSDSFMRKFRQM